MQQSPEEETPFVYVTLATHVTLATAGYNPSLFGYVTIGLARHNRTHFSQSERLLVKPQRPCTDLCAEPAEVWNRLGGSWIFPGPPPPTIRRMIKKKQRLYNKAKKTRKSKYWDMFHCLKHDTRKALWNAHNTYLSNIFTTSMEENNSNIFLRCFKAQRPESTGVTPLIHDGQLHSRSKDKAEILSDQFKSVFTQDDGGAIPQLEGHAYPSIGHLHISAVGLAKLLHSLKVCKVSGPEIIPVRVLKELIVDSLSLPLSAFFNHSLELGVVPSDCKSAFITPIFKKGTSYTPRKLSASVPHMHLLKIARACDMQAHPWPSWAT